MDSIAKRNEQCNMHMGQHLHNMEMEYTYIHKHLNIEMTLNDKHILMMGIQEYRHCTHFYCTFVNKYHQAVNSNNHFRKTMLIWLSIYRRSKEIHWYKIWMYTEAATKCTSTRSECIQKRQQNALVQDLNVYRSGNKIH